jgi:NAD(P)-dependent dehydrogenase (short-subunit alcohol dehydrogenase family)
MSLDGKVAIVTGAGSGIGESIARGLASRGARVVVTDIDPTGARRTADQIRRADGQAEISQTDVGDSAQVSAMVDRAISTFGGLDILVNNAGIVLQRMVVDTSDDEWLRVLRVDLFGPFYAARAAARRMITAGRGGHIVNISSIMARQTRPLNGAYTAAKAGLEGFSRALALELAPHGITVNCVAPGHIATPLTQPMFTPDVKRAFEARIPLGTIGQPEWVADVVAYLASDEARYVTGQVVLVDGGYMINGDLPGVAFGPND